MSIIMILCVVIEAGCVISIWIMSFLWKPSTPVPLHKFNINFYDIDARESSPFPPFVLQFLYGCIYTINKLHGTCIQDFLHKYCTSTIVHHRDSSSHSFNYSCMAQKGCKLQEIASYNRLKLSAIYSWSMCVTMQVHLHKCYQLALFIKLRGSDSVYW